MVYYRPERGSIMYRINFNDTARKSITLSLFALFLLTCIFSLMIGSTFHIAEPPVSYLGINNAADTAEMRTDFLKSLGYSPDEQSEESEDILIPAEFSDVYKNYNDLQKESGCDLSLYKGAACTRYTYIDTETGRRLNLIVYKNRIIGGDSCTPSLTGDMTPLNNGQLTVDS